MWFDLQAGDLKISHFWNRHFSHLFGLDHQNYIWKLISTGICLVNKSESSSLVSNLTIRDLSIFDNN